MKLGQFDRSAFKRSGEQVFDRMFGFERGMKESFDYANVQKNGGLEQKIELSARELEFREEWIGLEKELRLDNLLEGLLREDYQEGLGEMFRKKRKRSNEQDQGLSM